MSRRIGWFEWAMVVGCSLAVGAAQCGHESANDKASESSATAESPSAGESSGGESESGENAKTREEQMRRAETEKVANPDVDRSTVEQLVDDNTAFGLELYGHLRGDRPKENLFFAPYNLSYVLAMALPGAKGETKSQIKKALRVRLKEPDLHHAFNMLNSALESSGEGGTKGPGGGKGEESAETLRTANAIWAQEGMSLREPFLQTLAKHYGTGVRPVDFENAPEEARGKVNDWAANRTNDKIQDLLPSGSVDSRTRLILTAAIYFQAAWESTFDEENTEQKEFANLSGESSEVDMMHQKLRKGYRYGSGSNYQAVELPYASGAYSMVVVLPDEGAFSQVESGLDAAFLQSVFDGLEQKAVDLSLPKFELSTSFSAASALRKLGMAKAFENSADFSGMTEDVDLAVDDVLHKAYVSVDEKGTEAAAASAAAMRATSMPAGEPDYKEVTVDRPFMVAIRHTGSDTVLFLGRIVSL